jgi:hypothetical protein
VRGPEVDAHRTHGEALTRRHPLRLLTVGCHRPRPMGEVPHHHAAGPSRMCLDHRACRVMILVPVEVMAGHLGAPGQDKGAALGLEGGRERQDCAALPVERDLLLRRIGPHRDLLSHRGPPVEDDGLSQIVSDRRVHLVFPCARAQVGGQPRRHPAGDVYRQSGSGRAAKVTLVAVPISNCGDDSTRGFADYLPSSRVLVGQAGGTVGGSAGGADDDVPGRRLGPRMTVLGHGVLR